MYLVFFFHSLHFMHSSSVVSMLEEFRRLAFSFAVPLMVVDGTKLLALAGSYRVETKPTPQVCVCVLVYIIHNNT